MAGTKQGARTQNRRLPSRSPPEETQMQIDDLHPNRRCFAEMIQSSGTNPAMPSRPSLHAQALQCTGHNQRLYHETSLQILALPLTSWVILDSSPIFPHLSSPSVRRGLTVLTFWDYGGD